MVFPSGIKSIPDFIQIRPAVLELNHAERRTDIHDQPHILSLHARRAKNAYKYILVMWCFMKFGSPTVLIRPTLNCVLRCAAKL
jgi:hypothetical protein